jgi:hypothetical protein
MQRPISGRFLLTLFLYLCIHSIKALTIYISPLGNDNALGTSPAQAYQTITKLNSLNLAPGTIVLFEGGQNFSGTILLNSSDGNDQTNPIKISSYGVGRAIVQSGSGMGLYAYNTKGFEVKDLIFEGSGVSSNLTDGVKIHTDLSGDVKLENIKITNVEIRNYGVVGLLFYGANYNTGFKDVLIDQVYIHNVRENGLFIKGHTSSTHIGWSHENFTIRNTEVSNVTGYADATTHRGSGIIMAQVSGGVIEKCLAHHNGTANIHCGGPGGIWAYDCNNVIIQHNESYNNSSGTGCDGLGFDLDGGMVNSVLQYNYSHNNDGAGYLLGQYDGARTWSNNIVRYNISENDGRTNSGGITLFKGPNSSMNGCKIYNNTVHTSPSAMNTGVGALTITDWNAGINGVEVYNNIFQTTGGAYLVDVPTGYDADFAGNLYWSSGGTFKIRYHGTNYNSVASWRTASGKEQVGNLLTGVTADPQLSNAGAGGVIWPLPTTSLAAYKTPSLSPSVNAGLDLNNLFAINSGSVDFYNSVLPAFNARDIGAYEAPSSSSSSTSMPTPTIVANHPGPLSMVGAQPSRTAPQPTTDLSEENLLLENISYYPNPIRTGEDLHVKGGEAPYSLELYTINGTNIVKQLMYGDLYHIPEGQIANGIYIIRILDAKNRLTSGKIIIR